MLSAEVSDKQRIFINHILTSLDEQKATLNSSIAFMNSDEEIEQAIFFWRRMSEQDLSHFDAPREKFAELGKLIMWVDTEIKYMTFDEGKLTQTEAENSITYWRKVVRNVLK